MTSVETRSWMEYWLKWCLEYFGLEESRAIWKESYAAVAKKGKEGATVDEWVAIVASIIEQRHPESVLQLRHAKTLFERRSYERPS